MEVRYGDRVKLWATSRYIINEPQKSFEIESETYSPTKSPASTTSSPSPSPQSSPTKSRGRMDSNAQRELLNSYTGGYLGYYEKNGRHGVLSCVPPLGVNLNHLFVEETFEIIDPYARHAASEVVQYGHPIVLQNQFGMVWNNKTGGITGYVGPRMRKIAGELYVKLQRSKTVEGDEPVCYGDGHIRIHVASSNRHSTHYDKALTNFKKGTSQTLGGYICSDGSGYALEISVHPIEPSISRVSGKLAQYQNTNVSWGDSIPVSVPKYSTASVQIDFSSRGMIQLSASDIEAYAQTNSSFVTSVQNAPGGVVVQVYPVETEASQEEHVVDYSSNPQKHQQILGPVATSVGVLVVAIVLAILVDQNLLTQTSAMWIAIGCWSPLMAVFVYGFVSAPEHGEIDEDSLITIESYTVKLHRWIFNPDQQRTVVEPVEPEYPARFLAAEKGDHAAALKRWKETVAWRKENGMDFILSRPHERFELIKKYFPHYFHARGKNNEPVYFEKSAKTDLKALRREGITLDILLRHYSLITEFLWTRIEPSEEGRSITVIDIQGIGFRDFVGETVDFVRKASEFTSKHYPERAAYIYVLNVPSWFNIIWNVVKPMIDEVTRKKVFILRGKKVIEKALQETIPIENIPPEYGGVGPCLGESEEEKRLAALMAFNNGKGPKTDDFYE